MTTWGRHLYAKFAIVSSIMAEENTWRIGTAMDFWDFLLENRFLKGGKVYSCGQAQSRQVWYPSKKRIWSYSLQKNVHYCIMYG